MTNKEYHEAEGISKSDLDLIHKSPLHFVTAKTQPEKQTESLLFGSALHKYVLEKKDYNSEFITAPVCDRRTKEGKAIYADFVEQAAGKSITTSEQSERILNMSKAIFQHPLASKLLTGGTAEQSYFWRDNDSNILCKCRPDYIKGNYCIDLKTTQSAKPDDFMKSAYNYRYYVQSYWYLKGLKASGIDVENFIFIAVEKEPPYAICVYVASEDFLKLGEVEAESDFAVYKKCLETGNWYGYDETPEVHSLELPDWARKELYNE